jgi:hypothetical protein
MIKFKQILATFTVGILLGLSSAQAQNKGFTPLLEIMNSTKSDANDPASNGYIMERCAAFYAVWAVRTDDETDPKTKQLNELARTRYSQFQEVAIFFNAQGTKLDYATTIINIVDLGKIYSDRMHQQQLRTANSLDDELVMSDMKTCNMLYEKLIKPKFER